MTSSNDMLQGLANSILEDNNLKFASEQKFGKKLLITAWAVEIMAASLGLLIAFFMAYDAYFNSGNQDFSRTLNAILGALPFLLIAIIEPTKIPLAGGLYKVKSWGWKTLILAALLGLTAVTFETIFTGLERQVTNVTGQVHQGITGIQNIEDKNSEIERKIAENEKINLGDRTADLDKNILENNELLSAEVSKETQNYETRKINLEQQEQKLITDLNKVEAQRRDDNQKRISALEKPLDTLNIRINKKQTERDKLIETQTQRQQGNLRDAIIVSYEASIATVRAKIDEVQNWLLSQETVQIKKAQTTIGVLDDGKAGDNTNRNFQNWRSKQEEQISSLNIKIDDRRREIEQNAQALTDAGNSGIQRLSEELQSLEADRTKSQQAIQILSLELVKSNTLTDRELNLKQSIEKINLEISALTNEHNSNIDVIRNNRSAIQKNLEDNKKIIEGEFSALKNTVPSLRNEFSSNLSEINTKKEELRVLAQKNQIYRFAQKWKGYDDILEVSEKDLTVVSTIWFGSIALICATVGTILALISYIMTDPDAFVEKQKQLQNNPIRRSLRKLFVAIRKKLLVKPKIIRVDVPVEVEKIVEVERIVEKIVEIKIREEVDKLVPEIIPIPIFVPNGGDAKKEIAKVSDHYDELNKRVKASFFETARKHEDYDKSK